MIDQGCKVKETFHWKTVVTIHPSGAMDNLHYFGVKIDDMLYICGGCTDFSGEGGHGRKLAEYYLKPLAFTMTEQNGDDLINRLLGYYD